MSLSRRTQPLLIILALAAGLAACGKPEQDAYTQTSGNRGAVPTEVKTPAPPLPDWSIPLMGQSLVSVTKGVAPCKGALDVAVKHTGAQAGTAIEGWGWDVNGRRPLARLLFTDAQSRIVGAADVKLSRPDVVKAMPQVNTPKVGWIGTAHATSGIVTAIGLTSSNASCVIASRNL